MRSLGRHIKAILHGGYQRRLAEAVAAVYSLLTSDPPLVKEAWIRIRGWHKDASDRPPPARVTIKQMTSERVELYQHVPHPGRYTTLDVTPFPVEDSIPGEAEIVEEVKHLCLKRPGGPSVMRV